MSNPIPGWYADPAGSPQLRWWDGRQWTNQFRPAQGQGAATSAASPVTPKPTATSAPGFPAQGAAAAQGAPLPQFVAATPRAKTPTGLIVGNVIVWILAVVFALSTLIFGSALSIAHTRVEEAQNEVDQANSLLQQAQEEAGQ